MKVTESDAPLSGPRFSDPLASTTLEKVAMALKVGKRFLLTNHKEPDGDGIGSMLALGQALLGANKDVVLFTEKPVPEPFDQLRGADRIIHDLNDKEEFDAVVILDCGEIDRLGNSGNSLRKHTIINIDHHETNDFFGDLNLVKADFSSTGELVFGVIKTAGLPMSYDVAENIFTAIQTDTGSFSYDNTTPNAFKIAAEMLAYGVKPGEVSRKIMGNYRFSRLALLELALGTIEFYHRGQIAVMTLTGDLFELAGANCMDSERFVDYPRFVVGVEIAVLIRQNGENEFKFSLRSNGRVNVALLALKFGGGGHARAAGFERYGSVEQVKKEFLEEAAAFLDGTDN